MGEDGRSLPSRGLLVGPDEGEKIPDIFTAVYPNRVERKEEKAIAVIPAMAFG